MANDAQKTECCITTVDNPFDPFDEFIKWFLFDCEKGYNTCSYLARIAKTSDELSDNENAIEIERAIDEIIMFDPLNIYKKVKRPVFSSKRARVATA